MIKEIKVADKQESGNCSDDKTLTEVEYLEYMSKKTKTVNTITYPDGSIGKLNKGVIVFL